ncbi:hypothetical protein NDU88_009696 [Pleurodeles waltl]|uniref:Uncharacterized protein n=1 Tax=Pleurodeles waltl TaxID=8319 RepID=A0AAV7QVD3_PLEWA|nr:hypothetical protein NDU88_009696 [Pleurodeles waltl]
MDRILQEILAVSRKLESMDSAMTSLTAETKSMRLDIAGFQTQVSGLHQRVTTVESQVASWVDRDQELLHLRSKLMDLEDRSRRNNIRLLGYPENIEGADIYSYLPCLLRHTLARQLLQAARAQVTLQSDNLEIRLMADFSKETKKRRKAFLSLRPRLRQLDVKYGLLEPARMWITKNGDSRDFYDPEDQRAFLEGLQDQTQSMDMTTRIPQDPQGLPLRTTHPTPASVLGSTLLRTEFYHTYAGDLANKYLEVFDDVLTIGCLPTSIREAVVVMKPKLNRDPGYVTADHPISLLNLFTKILAVS